SPFLFQRHIAHLKPDPATVDSGYLKYALVNPFVRRQADRVANGVAQKTITLSDLREFLVACPPMPEQRRTAAILDQADELQRKQRRISERLSSLSASIFDDLFGDPITNPHSWENDLVLGDVANVVSGVTKGRSLKGRGHRSVPYLAV